MLLPLFEWLLWAILMLVDGVLSLVYYPYLWLRYRVIRNMTRSKDVDAEEPSLHGAPKTVVIVGGNFAGLSALRELAYNPACHVILIDQRSYFEYVPGVLRLFCEPSLLSTMAKAIPKGSSYEFLLGSVTSVSTDHLMVARLSGIERVEFDYLILATGADYRQPISAIVAESSLPSRLATWEREAARLRDAGRILVLGGGAVGTELAAEISCYYPEKALTIIDGARHLVPLFPAESIGHVERWFCDRGVALMLGEMLDKWDETSCTLKDGRVIEADIVYVCFGLRCNSQCVSSGDMSGSLSERKEVRVNDSLQVEGTTNVFATGDVMVHPSREIKQAYYAEMNGKMAALNVERHIRGEALHKYPDYLAGAPVMPLVYVVSLGRYNGSLGFNQMVMQGPIAALVKWFIEWTKVAQMEGRPIGLLTWELGDAVTFLLSRTCIKPAPKAKDLTHCTVIGQ